MVSLRICGRVKLFFVAGFITNETKFVLIFGRADCLEIEKLGIDGGICEEATSENLTW